MSDFEKIGESAMYPLEIPLKMRENLDNFEMTLDVETQKGIKLFSGEQTKSHLFFYKDLAHRHYSALLFIQKHGVQKFNELLDLFFELSVEK